MGRCIVAVAFIGSESVKAECRNDNLAKHGGDSHIGIHVDFQRSLRASILTVLGPFDELVALSRLGSQRDNSSVLVLCSLGSIISDFDSASRLWLRDGQRVFGYRCRWSFYYFNLGDVKFDTLDNNTTINN